MNKTETNPNLAIWDALKHTDPAHTKAFTRSGGFKGTAIKPIYSVERMTSLFGPCGVGWGTEKPEFTIERLTNEVCVYCTVALWYKQGGEKCVVYGVGGDKVLTSRGSDDEAFKKAYTDAAGNAMKQIGMSADVHMGLFDDSKYVEEMKQEFAPAPKKVIPKAQAEALRAALIEHKIPRDDVRGILLKHGFETCNQITEDKYGAVSLEFQSLIDFAAEAAKQEVAN
jgi:uncharacterized short protein YbdD (DUF466 family)